MDQNRYEEVPQKKKPLKIIGQQLKMMWISFIDSFKYNNMKLASLLVALPGLLYGFFLIFHAPVLNALEFQYQVFNDEKGVFEFFNYPGMPFNYAGMVVFLIMLLGILNVFIALSMSSQKNLGSVVIATIFTVLIIACSALYYYAIRYYIHLVTEGEFIAALDDISTINPDDQVWANFKVNYMRSIILIGVFDVLSVIGVVLGYINYDRTYEKVNR